MKKPKTKSGEIDVLYYTADANGDLKLTTGTTQLQKSARGLPAQKARRKKAS